MWLWALYHVTAGIVRFIGSTDSIGDEWNVLVLRMRALLMPAIAGLCSALLFRRFPTIALIAGACALWVIVSAWFMGSILLFLPFWSELSRPILKGLKGMSPVAVAYNALLISAQALLVGRLLILFPERWDVLKKTLIRRQPG